jgi:hypothetical protein
VLFSFIDMHLFKEVLEQKLIYRNASFNLETLAIFNFQDFVFVHQVSYLLNCVLEKN